MRYQKNFKKMKKDITMFVFGKKLKSAKPIQQVVLTTEKRRLKSKSLKINKLKKTYLIHMKQI